MIAALIVGGIFFASWVVVVAICWTVVALADRDIDFGDDE